MVTYGGGSPSVPLLNKAPRPNMAERWGCRNVIVSERWGLMSGREQYRNQQLRLLSVIGVYLRGHIWSSVWGGS